MKVTLGDYVHITVSPDEAQELLAKQFSNYGRVQVKIDLSLGIIPLTYEQMLSKLRAMPHNGAVAAGMYGSNKINDIKALRQWTRDNGYCMGLAESKKYVEEVFPY